MGIPLQTASHTVNYTYDSNGLRVTKTVDTPPNPNRDRLRWSCVKHIYQYVGGLLRYESRGDISFIYDYDAYGHLSCINYMWANGSYWKFYVACNARGDVTAIYGADGIVRAKYTYDSWGNTLSITDANGTPLTEIYGEGSIAAGNIGTLNMIRYRGYYYDSESGLYYLQSRYYDPQVKRFLNADGYVSTGKGLLSTNMFAYCGNNPVNRIDPAGHAWVEGLNNVFNKIIVKMEKCLEAAKSSKAISSNAYLDESQMQHNAKLVYGYLADEGWSHNSICAVLGNMQKESTINPGRHQVNGTAFGLVQWDPASKYTDWANANGHKNDSMIGQLKFLIYSMQPGSGEWLYNQAYPNYYMTYNDFISSNDSVDYLTGVFLYAYERAGVPCLDERITYAQYWSNYFK